MLVAMDSQASTDCKELVDEIARYLAAVDVFRAAGCEPTWRCELVPAYSLQGINGTVRAFGPNDYHTTYSLPWNAKGQQTIGIVLWGDDPTAKKGLGRL